MIKENPHDSVQIKTDILNRFSQLPDKKPRETERMLTKIAVEDFPQESSVFLSLIEDETSDSKTRFYAFFSLATIYRRNKDITKFKELDYNFGSLFNTIPLYWHLKSLLYRQSKSTYKLALENAVKAKDTLPEHPGVLHSYAEIVALMAEDEQERGRDCETKENCLAFDHLDSAVAAIDQALELESDYAKFYCTKGRLLALQGEFDKGQKSILKAIDKENSNEKDYAIRINEYMYIMTRIEREQMLKFSEKQIEEVSAQATKLKADAARLQLESENRIMELKLSLEEVRTQNLQILGFFTAIISFTIASIQILNQQTFKDASLLIVVLIGALLTGYSGFFALMPTNQVSMRRILTVALSGIALILVSVAVYSFT